MCGIAGLIQNNQAVSAEGIKSMIQALSHRGPDAEGIFISENGCTALAHRRLSILDLSSDANQPMTSQCGRYVIVFNGEVYNYREIANELNLSLRTLSDTEVVLAAFSKLGVSFIEKLNGMFALAIYDKEKDKTFLLRDRIGIKPLYYYQDDQCVAFASELKSLIQLPFIAKQLAIDPAAVTSFLHLGYIPKPLSIYKKIKKFPQGHYAWVDGKGDLAIHAYWKPEDQVGTSVIKNKQEAFNQLEKIVEDSVALRLRSDAPFGAFLSGGIDSSLVATLASNKLNKPLKTFSIGFEHQQFNEIGYAEKVAKVLGTDHHQYILQEKEAIDLLDEYLLTYDEPFADSSGIPSMLVSRLASKKVKMVLTGDGGDELFMGYGMYQWAERLNNPLLRLARQPIYHALKALPSQRYQRAATLFADDGGDLKSHIFSQEQYLFSKNELAAMLKDGYAEGSSFAYRPTSLARKLFPAEGQAFFDLQYYLPDDLLVKVDRATMKYGLEARVPLLDYRLVEFSLNLHKSLKINGGAKYLLKQLLYKHLPKALFDRPKWGFSIPLANWLHGEMKERVINVLSPEIVAKVGIVKPAYVAKLLQEFYGGRMYLYNRVWVLYLLHSWHFKQKG